MVTIFIWDVFQLPPALGWLAPWLSLIGTALFWMLAALVLRAVIFGAVRWLTRRTETDIDDVILDASSAELFAVVVLFGLYNSFERLGFQNWMVDGVERALVLAIIGMITYWVWRIFKEVIIYYGRHFAEATESNLDDVLLPIANQLGPIVIFLAGALATLQYLGVDLSSLIVAVGGASFILAFALQDILSNIFSGLALVVDTPFAYRDLIVLSDGRLCEVRRIGLRVTELYDVNTHSIIYMPNSHLANERLTNMTRPSPDLIDSLGLSVNDDADLDAVREILESVALGHPDILGNLDDKLAHLPRFAALESGEAKRANGLTRLRLEQQVDAKLNVIFLKIERLIHRVRGLEKGGLTKAEARQLESHFLPLLAEFGLVDREVKEGRRVRRTVEYNFDPASLLGLVYEWITVWACDPDLGGREDTRLDVAAYWQEKIDDPMNDAELLVAQWKRRIRLLCRRLAYLREKFTDPRGVEQRLDDLLLDLARWIRANFKEPEPKWKGPDVNFNGPDDKGMAFTVEFFIDDIELEHFERQERVQRELQTEIVRRFREAKIDMPYSQQVINFRADFKLPWGKS
jgi:MscS family membrane protein